MVLVSKAVLVAAVLAAGLIAGLFYAYTVSVMPGLAQADDHTFVTAMRRINDVIVNGWFMLSFLGAPLLAIAAVVLHFTSSGQGALPWLVAGAALLVATVLVTGAINVPMNNALAVDTADFAALRARFEEPWVRWNLARTVLSAAGFGCLVGGLVARGA
ncbi:anthrone oxygenase family protein [Amycolatopsis orientalis]|uniref:anthrone oxygenase family protein n=1 Tax=Amycolatopsis orientalis TaxID=31958 RepID=UPI0003A3F4AF|nr:anthrone oxygenase family protein [Amycolatopsis orientalis]